MQAVSSRRSTKLHDSGAAEHALSEKSLWTVYASYLKAIKRLIKWISSWIAQICNLQFVSQTYLTSSFAKSDLWSWCPKLQFYSLQFHKQLQFSSFFEQNIISTHNSNYLLFEIGILLEMSIKNVIWITIAQKSFDPRSGSD